MAPPGSVLTREEPYVVTPLGTGVFTGEEPSVVVPLGTSVFTGEESSVVAPPGSVLTREESSVVAPLGTSVFESSFVISLALDRRTPEIQDIDILPSEVESKLRSLNPSSAPGPDEVHPRVLRQALRELGRPLTILFRKSLDSGTVPLDWTLGSVVPIHKKGNRQEPGNYRPVSLTSVVSKVLESLIRDRLLQHL